MINEWKNIWTNQTIKSDEYPDGDGWVAIVPPHRFCEDSYYEYDSDWTQDANAQISAYLTAKDEIGVDEGVDDPDNYTLWLNQLLDEQEMIDEETYEELIPDDLMMDFDMEFDEMILSDNDEGEN